MRWHGRLIAAKWTYKTKGVGRPGLMKRIKSLSVRMASDHPTWGYCRIQGGLKSVGHRVASTAFVNVLKDNGIQPAPEGPSSWRSFLKVQRGQLAATDFFSVEDWTPRGLQTYYALFVINLKSRRVHVAGLTTTPSEAFMEQVARNWTACVAGFLRDHRTRICD